MQRLAIIGAGISGLTAAQLLKGHFETIVFEKEDCPGGLIKCERVNDSLFHQCGGHVFNSHRLDVLEWFWTTFNQEKDFVRHDRNSVIHFSPKLKVPYPIENYIYKLPASIQNDIIHELLKLETPVSDNTSLEQFFKHSFGETLYKYYFQPYNEKIWRSRLSDIPTSWLHGKLPMPKTEEIIFNNFNRVTERSFVHSSFWYPQKNGSQFIVDKLSMGLKINFRTNINAIIYKRPKWIINGEEFDKVIFCGNIKDLPVLIKGVNISSFFNGIKKLKYHGTTSVFCEIHPNPYTWIYLPDPNYKAHRIICTGNMSDSNNAHGVVTATVEFTDFIETNNILKELKKIPYVRSYITHSYHQFTYPIQSDNTREMIKRIKNQLRPYNFYITGRFADWEYYNMDGAIGAAMDNARTINS